jgi:hypothetical protein
MRCSHTATEVVYDLDRKRGLDLPDHLLGRQCAGAEAHAIVFEYEDGNEVCDGEELVVSDSTHRERRLRTRASSMTQSSLPTLRTMKIRVNSRRPTIMTWRC